MAGVPVALLLLTEVDGNGAAALLAVLAFVVGAVAAARLLPGQEGLQAPAGVLVLALLAL